MKLGLIGYGAIGKYVEAAHIEDVELVSILVKRPRNQGLVTHEPDRFFARKVDAVAECAGHEAVRAHGERVLESGADFLVTGDKPLLAVRRVGHAQIVSPHRFARLLFGSARTG